MIRYYLCPLGHRIPLDAIVNPILDLTERVLPGEPLPLGECPACEELVSADQESELEEEAANAIFEGSDDADG